LLRKWQKTLGDTFCRTLYIIYCMNLNYSDIDAML